MAKASLAKAPSAGLAAPRRASIGKPVKIKPAPDPLADVGYSGDLGTDQAREFTALDLAFKSDAKSEKRKHQQVIDSEFWVALCFESREQKETFLMAVDMIKHGDKYLDGNLFAKACNIELSHEAPPTKERGIDPKLAALAL